MWFDCLTSMVLSHQVGSEQLFQRPEWFPIFVLVRWVICEHDSLTNLYLKVGCSLHSQTKHWPLHPISVSCSLRKYWKSQSLSSNEQWQHQLFHRVVDLEGSLFREIFKIESK